MKRILIGSWIEGTDRNGIPQKAFVLSRTPQMQDADCIIQLGLEKGSVVCTTESALNEGKWRVCPPGHISQQVPV